MAIETDRQRSGKGGWTQWLRARWPRRAPAVVGLRAADVDERDLDALRRVVDDIASDLGVRITLDGPGPFAAVLLDLDQVTRSDPARVRDRAAGLPAILFEQRPSDHGRVDWVAQRAELERQLRALPVLRRYLSDDSGRDAPASSQLSTLLDADLDDEPTVVERVGQAPDPALRQLVAQVLRGLRDDSTPTLHARYPGGGAVRVDFAGWRAQLDPSAVQALRLRLELPTAADDARPGDDASTIELDAFIWHLGLACGRFVLLDQPADAWHTALVPLTIDRVERYSRQPRHLELARRLTLGPATPEVLRRHVHVGVDELRGFLQACLFLGLVHWELPPRDAAGLDDR